MRTHSLIKIALLAFLIRKTLEIANAQLRQIKSDLEEARAEAAALGEDLLRAGAPWVEGNRLPN